MVAEKALLILRDGFDEKQRQRGLDALEEVAKIVAETGHLETELREALTTLADYDSTYTNISIAEGIRRLRERINEQSRETSSERILYARSGDVITACKVALVESITADHRWHTPEEACPHFRCVALNKIEALRDGG